MCVSHKRLALSFGGLSLPLFMTLSIFLIPHSGQTVRCIISHTMSYRPHTNFNLKIWKNYLLQRLHTNFASEMLEQTFFSLNYWGMTSITILSLSV